MIYGLTDSAGATVLETLPERTTLGSDSNSTLVVPVPEDGAVGGAVLGQHLALEVSDGGVRLVAMDARAMLLVNGRQVPNNFGLLPGDRIELGASSFALTARCPPGVTDPTPWQLLPRDNAPDDSALTLDEELVVGREDQCDLQLLHGYVSRRHARVVQAGGALWVADLDSANGTFVNGRRISGSVRLHPADIVQFDEVKYSVAGPDLSPPGAAATMIRPPVPTTMIRPPDEDTAAEPPPPPPPATPAAADDDDPELDLEPTGSTQAGAAPAGAAPAGAAPAEAAPADAAADEDDDDPELELTHDETATVVAPATPRPEHLMTEEQRHRQVLLEQGIDPDDLDGDAGGTMVSHADGPAAQSPTDPGSGPQLVVMTGPEPGVSYRLREGARLVIGRDADSDICLPETSVSSRHCQCQLQGGMLNVENLISSNGIFVNGERVTGSDLHNGDILQIGRVEMVFETSPGAAAHVYTERAGLPPWVWMLLGFGVATTAMVLLLL